MANDTPTNAIPNRHEPSTSKATYPQTDALLTEKQTARILGLKQQTLRAFRVSGRGPPFIRISRRAIRYQISDIDDYIQSCRRTSTSDMGEVNYD